MNRLEPLTVFVDAWKRRFHPLERAGYATSRGASTRTQTIIGLSMLGIGFYIRRRRKHSKIYGYTVKPGKTVRIKVTHGPKTLTDATIGS